MLIQPSACMLGDLGLTPITLHEERGGEGGGGVRAQAKEIDIVSERITSLDSFLSVKQLLFTPHSKYGFSTLSLIISNFPSIFQSHFLSTQLCPSTAPPSLPLHLSPQAVLISLYLQLYCGPI